MTEWKCINGHDLCHTTYPGPDCPYCEKKQKRRQAKSPRNKKNQITNAMLAEFLCVDVALVKVMPLEKKKQYMSMLVKYDEIQAYLSGKGPMPKNVILCKERSTCGHNHTEC